ncbi:cyclin-dependent kinase inhibitor 4-like [Gastrolobium bilobum]|uniref:cyclin-dependent kinase inhibitor 4-like n=1 Tax=Gastrolobium bilobum TaxID=150636 RepID=UPI002AB23879|nr:cyclin-dependent kinase inhibitor 4-like [Gastrolobium bilobum]
MGKYMKKSRAGGGDVKVMEVSSPVGVRTRAKTLALRTSDDSSSFQYLQLRSRRLLKVIPTPPPPPPKKSYFCGASLDSRLIDEAEASFGENTLEVEVRDRSTRESTPCSLIRDSNAVDTPGSTTRKRTSTFTNQIIHENIQRNIPTAFEMEEFFAHIEQQQRTMFMDKYNFDIVNDVPLPGRYEWVQVHNH